MLGNRYGWIPLPSSIQKNDLQEILKVADENERNLIEQWYKLDANCLNENYYLKMREGIYIDDKIWENTEKKLKDIFCTCAAISSKSEKLMKLFSTSATEQEIQKGFFECFDKNNIPIVFFRPVDNIEIDDKEKLLSLHNRLRREIKMRGCESGILPAISNPIGSKEYGEEFFEKVTTTLKEFVLKEIEKIGQLDEITSYEDFFTQFEVNDIFIPRTQIYKELEEYISNDNHNPLFITGDSGSGKTTFLAKFLKEKYIEEKSVVFFDFYGMNDNSYTLREALRYILNQINEAYEHADIYEYKDKSNIYSLLLAPVFDSILEQASDYAFYQNYRNSIIAIDGLDMFHDIEDICENIFPCVLPPRVKLIVTYAKKTVADRFLPLNSKK